MDFCPESDGDGYEELDHSVKEPSQKERILFIALEKKLGTFTAYVRLRGIDIKKA